MLNTISNLRRKSDKYGDVHFISFLSAALARLAYLNDNAFLQKYNSIMGPIIVPKILESINNVNQNNLKLLLDDQTLFGLDKGVNDIFKDYEYQYNGKNIIDFIQLNMPQNINIINGDIAGTVTIPTSFQGYQTPSDSVKYISIGWSNYGEIYVVADKRMPNTIFLLFRGTYSAKTAALYSKPTSIMPLPACEQQTSQDKFLYGIFKASTEMIHTIIETIRYLATDFLGATQPNSVKIFTTGHSLGAAMCTNFAYLWMGIKTTTPYNLAPYNVLADNIVCVSLGAPRCMSVNAANKFCNYVKQNKILYLRITTNGDPVPNLPPAMSSKSGFQHPCSSDPTMRSIVSEACVPQLTMRPSPNINYKGSLDCLNYKGRIYAPNPLSHTVYLDILYTKAVDIVKFFKGIGISKEVLRTPTKSTVCRLVMGNAGVFKAIFFDVNLARSVPNNVDAAQEVELSKPDPNAVSELMVPQSAGGWFSSLTGNSKPVPVAATLPAPIAAPVSQPVTIANTSSMFTKMSASIPKVSVPKVSVPTMKFGGKVAEDIRMTSNAFNSLINQMIQISGDLCPQKGQMATTTTFNTETVPDLSCTSVTKIGGKKYKKTIKKNNIKRQYKKTKSNRRK
jgi:hypothetical protein